MSILCKLLGHKPFRYDRNETSPHLYIQDINARECEKKDLAISFNSLCERCAENYVVGHALFHSVDFRMTEYIKENPDSFLKESEKDKFPPILPELLGN